MSPAREIEVKYQADDLAVLTAELHRRGANLSAPVYQDDQAYAQDGWRYGMSKLGVAFARLRTQDGRHLFTLKRPTDNEMACLEFETEVADREVEHIGAFLEIEKVVGPGQSGEAVQAELHAFACSLGVELERTTDTYDSLIRAALAGV